MKDTVRDRGEFGLISEFAKQFRKRSRSVVLGIGDDAALLESPPRGELLVWTVDAVVEGVHFRRSEHPAWRIGWKALAVNVSDLAAMGARPETALFSIGIPPDTPLAFIRAVAQGVERCARRFSVTVVGGNVSRARCLFISVSLQGRVARRKAVLRSGAKPGDALMVTGTLSFGQRHHATFEPRLREAMWLAERFRPTSMIDISDGLLSDLRHVCEASACGAHVWLAALPAPSAERRRALSRGEAYELLFSMPPGRVSALERAWRARFMTPLARIGRFVAKRGARVFAREGSRDELPCRETGFRHF